nr:hypothetical protein [Tanacetum cinerariifolium]
MKELLQAPTEGDVHNDVIKLMIFPYSLEGNTRVWYDKEPPYSILTWEDLVNKFVNQFFPPSKTTHLKNEISRFSQRFEETFGEAWERFKEMLRACLHHGFTELAQIDTFYNGLHDNDQDSLNVVACGNLLSKTTREALQRIENKSKVCYSRNKSNVSRMNMTFRKNVSKTDDRIDKLTDQISTLVDIFAKKVVTLSPVKAVKESCVTCGGAHDYYNCPNTDSNQPSVCVATCIYNQVAPQNHASNYMAPPGFASAQNGQNRLNDQKLHEKAMNQMDKFFQVFQDLHFDISFADALILMPKFASTIKSLLTNKDKLFELAKIPLNENCSAMLLKKHPEKLRDPGKFLILCDFPGMDVCHALADLDASINLMPLFIWKKLSLPELTPTRMTLEIADRSITRPKGVAEDVFIKAGKFHFPTDFVVVDFEAGRPVTFNLNQTTRYSSTYDDLSVNRFDIIDVAREEYAQEILEAIDAYLKDESVSPEIGHVDCDLKLDICLIEKLLNDDPFQLPLMDLKQGEVIKEKSSIKEPSKLELKELPSHLEYAYLEGVDKLPIIIAKDLKVDEKEALLKVLKSHKRAIAWNIIEIKDTMLQRCEDTNLVLNWEKFHFMVKEGIVLGHKISKNGREVDRSKVDVIAKLPYPTTVKDVRSFLGHVGFYRRFSQDFSKIARPMTHLLEKETPFVFSKNCIDAFETLKNKCTEAPILVVPDWNLPFELMCDASDFAIGAVLGQRKMKHFQPIHYATYTDHSALKYLLSKQDAKPRLIRWVFLLQEFDIIIRDKKGMENLAADHLSRLENPHKNVFENKDINENFSLETLGKISSGSTSWFADFTHFYAGNFIVKGMSSQQKKKFFKDILWDHSRLHEGIAIINDRGTYFCNDKFAKVISKYGVTHHLSTAYHPQTSGQVEVSNRVLKRILERTVRENRASWSEKLDDGLWAFRTAYKTPIGCTPYKLVYGKSCNLLIELVHKAYWALKHVNFDLKTMGDHRKLQLNELNELRDQAYENSLIYKENTMKIHDSKIKNRIFNVGHRVLLFNSRLKIFSKKRKTRWSRPFTITKVFPYGTVELSQPDGPNFKVVIV